MQSSLKCKIQEETIAEADDTDTVLSTWEQAAEEQERNEQKLTWPRL